MFTLPTAGLGVVRVLVLGLACVASGQVWLTRLADNGSYVTGVLPGLLLASVGMGLVFPCLAVAVSSGVEPAEQGSASALLASSQQTGSAAGLALLVTLAAGRSAAAGGSLVAGYQLSFAIGAGLIMVAAGMVVLLFGRVSVRPLGGFGWKSRSARGSDRETSANEWGALERRVGLWTVGPRSTAA